MILVDTSIWVDHLRVGNKVLSGLLGTATVLAHPFVIGELALGDLRQRQLVLDTLHGLPQAVVASHDEVLHFIAEHRLFASGIGYVDAHLLAAGRLMAGVTLWTSDKSLHAVADRLGLAADLPV